MLRLRWTTLILIATSVSGMTPSLTVTIRSARSRIAQSASVLSLGGMEAEVDVLADDDVCVLPLYYQEDELARRELASVEQAYIAFECSIDVWLVSPRAVCCVCLIAAACACVVPSRRHHRPRARTAPRLLLLREHRQHFSRGAAAVEEPNTEFRLGPCQYIGKQALGVFS